MKDYSNFYATAAQVIPVLILIYVVEGRGFRPAPQRSLRRTQNLAFVLLLLALIGEVLAFIALSFGSLAPAALTVPIAFGVASALYLTGLGLANVISDQRERGTSPEGRELGKEIDNS
jgi:hypothetical protein